MMLLNEDFDYNTAPVFDDDIFDTSTLGGFSGIARCIPGSDDYEYMIKEKNKKGEIVQMSPREYFDICARRFNTTVEKLKDQRNAFPEYIDKLTQVIIKKNERFPMCFIDYTNPGSQEGLHRMLVAANLFGWDALFPVLIVDWADKEKHEREEHDAKINRIRENIEAAFSKALKCEYEEIEEFKDELQWDLNKEFNGTVLTDVEPDVEFTLTFDDRNINVTVDNVTVSKPFTELKFKNTVDAENIDVSKYWDDSNSADLDFDWEDLIDED